MKLIIKNGTIINPAAAAPLKEDILIEKGRIVKIEKDITASGARTFDAAGKIVTPGLCDMHAHLREPGREDAETLASASQAAILGGYTDVCAMPDTHPVMDNQGAVEFLISKAKQLDRIHIWPIGAITKGLRGEEISEMAELKNAGCVALSDDEQSIENSNVARHAMEYASMYDLPLICHCEDRELSKGGVMNEGMHSTILGLSGIPRFAESIRVLREAELAKLTGARIHIAHISCKESVDIIRKAKAEGVRITSEVAPHNFSFTDGDLKTYNTNMKVNPPLRTAEDVTALKEGLKDGTIDVIATDHSPITENEKNVEFNAASFGVIGLQTALSASIRHLVEEGVLNYHELFEKMSANPANIIGLPGKKIEKGKKADLIVIDPEQNWECTEEILASKSKNSPYVNQPMKGRVVFMQLGTKTLLDGERPR